MLRLLAWLCVLAACKDDYEVRVVPHFPKSSPGLSGEWLSMSYDMLGYDKTGTTCHRDQGRVYFRRPENTHSLGAGRCYERDDHNPILVSLELPESAWRTAGWRRCDAAEEKAALKCCRGDPCPGPSGGP